MAVIAGGGAMALRQPVEAPMPAGPSSFPAVMELLAELREGILYGQLASCLHLVRFEPGHIEFRPTADAPRDLSTRLGQFLLEYTGKRWMISVSRDQGEPTIRQQAELREAARKAEVTAHPLVSAVLVSAVRGGCRQLRW